MNDEAEFALLAIAQPISWIEYPENRNPGYRGYWRRAEGTSERASYYISQRAEVPHVDQPPVQRVFGVSIRERDSRYSEHADVPSIARAKDICLRHAITGDLTEIRTDDTVLYPQEAEFVASEESAYAALKAAFELHKPRWLPWFPDDQDALEFRTPTPGGTYAARFDARRRWVATLTKSDGSGEEHCFLMGALAKMACSLHAYTGIWLGTFTPSLEAVPHGT